MPGIREQAHPYVLEAEYKHEVIRVERTARARFHVLRVNRWSLALALALALALLLLPGKRFLSVVAGAEGSGTATVQPGVTIGGRDFSGRSEAEAKAMLREMAAVYTAGPIGARETVTEGVSYVVPELNGFEMDVDSTWTRLAAAPANTRVEPATRTHTPVRRLSDFPQSVIRQGNPDKKAVGLLINVDWGENELRKMLPVLKKRGVKVTFFVSGRWADKNKHLLKAMSDDGHEIASHGYDLQYGPRDLARAGKLKDDIARSTAAIEAVTGAPVRYWAPHMSEVSPEIIKTASSLRLRTVLYSLDTVDWRPDTTPSLILTRISNAMAGDLILLHPKPSTAMVLDKALQQLLAKGLQPLTLSEMLSPDPDTSSSVGNGLDHR